MSRGFPSMTALLGLLAVAGYQNRDKIAEWLGGAGEAAAAPGGRPQGGEPAPQTGQAGGLGGMLEELRRNLGGAAAPGGILSGGLGELIDRFRQSGQAETADSWVRTGPNQPVAPPQLERAIGPEVLDTVPPAVFGT